MQKCICPPSGNLHRIKSIIRRPYAMVTFPSPNTRWCPTTSTWWSLSIVAGTHWMRPWNRMRNAREWTHKQWTHAERTNGNADARGASMRRYSHNGDGSDRKREFAVKKTGVPDGGTPPKRSIFLFPTLISLYKHAFAINVIFNWISDRIDVNHLFFK